MHSIGHVAAAIVAVVVLASPAAAAPVRLDLIGPDGNLQADCHVGEVAAVANAVGDVHLRLTEEVLASTIGFNVAVNTATVFGAPHWVGEQTVPRT